MKHNEDNQDNSQAIVRFASQRLLEAISQAGATLTQNGLVRTRDFTEEEFKSILSQSVSLSVQMRTCLNFLLGDLYDSLGPINSQKRDYILSQYGGYHKHLKNCGYVARRFEIQHRDTTLAWYTYETLASLSENLRLSCLNKPYIRRMTRQELREWKQEKYPARPKESVPPAGHFEEEDDMENDDIQPLVARPIPAKLWMWLDQLTEFHNKRLEPGEDSHTSESYLMALLQREAMTIVNQSRSLQRPNLFGGGQEG